MTFMQIEVIVNDFKPKASGAWVLKLNSVSVLFIVNNDKNK